MKRPNFKPIFDEKSDYCEKNSSQPIKSFIPGQAMNLSELISRFDRGQRLLVHNNFDPMSNFTKDSLYEESFEDAAPDGIYDVVDVENHYREHKVHKRDYEKRKSERAKKETKPSVVPPAAPADDPAK